MSREDEAKDAVDNAAEYPYDGDDDGNTALGDDWPIAAARAVIEELGHRCKGIQEIFDAVDDPVDRMLIVETAAEVIRRAKKQHEEGD